MMNKQNILTVDVEDWFHILDSPSTPELNEWGKLTLRAEGSIHQLLQLLSETGNKATFFWLGWMAEKMPLLVRKCLEEGHEIASHGYGHVLPYKVGQIEFRNDIYKAKSILENITGTGVLGFRAPGFGIIKKSHWAFDVIKEVGYMYDSSVFPAKRAHGGMNNSVIGPHILSTNFGLLPEIPASVIKILGKRFSLFGGGYLRITPLKMIHYGIRSLRKTNQPLIIYVHPREIDPEHPRLPLSFIRRFKSYINLSSTFPKLKSLCQSYKFCTMVEYVNHFMETKRRGSISDMPNCNLC
jgi:polysaccharide deacetylase family protein (PEP-CTERM system associated)